MEHLADSSDLGKGAQVVCYLVQNLQPGHKVYTDNYYTSPELFSKLKEKDLGAVGTVWANRRGLPDQKKLKQKKAEPTRHWRKRAMLAVSWCDKKQVNMLSTLYAAQFLDITVRGSPQCWCTTPRPEASLRQRLQHEHGQRRRMRQVCKLLQIATPSPSLVPDTIPSTT